MRNYIAEGTNNEGAYWFSAESDEEALAAFLSDARAQPGCNYKISRLTTVGVIEDGLILSET